MREIRCDCPAGGHDRPDAFQPALACDAAGTLSHLAINDHESNRLLRQVVGWFDARSRDEAQITGAVFFETFGQVACLGGVGHAPDDLGPKLVAGVLQMALKSLLAVLDAVMDDGKQSTQTLQDPLTIGLVARVRMLDKKAHVAQQMGQAELHQDAKIFHVLAIGAEIVAAQNALELLAQHVDEDIRAPRLIDFEQGEE